MKKIVILSFQSGIEPFCASIWNGMATIGGHLRKPDESINPFSIFDGKKSKNKSRETNILHTYTVDLLIPHVRKNCY